MNMRCHKRILEIFEDGKPDLVVSVHPTCQEVPPPRLEGDGWRHQERPVRDRGDGPRRDAPYLVSKRYLLTVVLSP